MKKERKTKQEEAAPQKHSALRENFSSLVATAVLALFFTTFVAQAFEIPSESMETTLLIGDRPFVEKVQFAPATTWLGPLLPYNEIHRGDIIVFKHPAEPARIHMVKRVIGLPGDKIKIVRRNVIVNGRFLNEGYKSHSSSTIDDYRDNFPMAPIGPVYPEWADAMPQYVKDGWLVVPAGHYFAMGDNRDNSLDSRYWGFVPRENILGKPMVLYWSINLPREAYMPRSLMDRLVGVVEVVISLPVKTRWGRLFLPIRSAQP